MVKKARTDEGTRTSASGGGGTTGGSETHEDETKEEQKARNQREREQKKAEADAKRLKKKAELDAKKAEKEAQKREKEAAMSPDERAAAQAQAVLTEAKKTCHRYSQLTGQVSYLEKLASNDSPAGHTWLKEAWGPKCASHRSAEISLSMVEAGSSLESLARKNINGSMVQAGVSVGCQRTSASTFSNQPTPKSPKVLCVVQAGDSICDLAFGATPPQHDDAHTAMQQTLSDVHDVCSKTAGLGKAIMHSDPTKIKAEINEDE